MPRTKKQVTTEKTPKTETKPIDSKTDMELLSEAKIRFLDYTTQIAKLTAQVTALEQDRDTEVKTILKLCEKVNESSLPEEQPKKQVRKTSSKKVVAQEKNIEVSEPETKVSEPVKKAPAKRQPAKKKLATKQVEKTEPVQNEEPVKKQPAKKQPAKKQPAKKQPAKKQAEVEN